jgi:hypothetical protein
MMSILATFLKKSFSFFACLAAPFFWGRNPANFSQF